jgi:hypothetical protein
MSYLDNCYGMSNDFVAPCIFAARMSLFMLENSVIYAVTMSSTISITALLEYIESPVVNSISV